MRLPGFEPGLEAWEAPVLPLDYSRAGTHDAIIWDYIKPALRPSKSADAGDSKDYSPTAARALAIHSVSRDSMIAICAGVAPALLSCWSQSKENVDNWSMENKCEASYI